MSGYDALARDLHRFHARLVRFDEELTAGLSELERQHEQIDPVWRDRFRREYDRRYEELSTPVGAYADSEADAFERFLAGQIRALRRYLDG